MSSSNDDKLPHLLYALSIVFSVLPIIIVALRFQVKTKSNPRIFWDDWMILLALVSCVVYAVFVIIGVAAGGLGRPLKRDSTGEPIYGDEFFIFQRVSYVTNAVQMLSLGPTKLAVLLLYRRIFGTERRAFSAVSLALMVLVAVWTVAFFFTNIFTYTPISDMWTKPPGQAHATFAQATQMYDAQCFADMALDVVIITLPLPQIWRLQMSVRLKMQISGVFLLGLITIGASVARAVVQYGVAEEFDTGNPDQTYYLCPGIYWALIESSVGITAASLPLLRPVGQIYWFRHLVLVSTKALSSIFTTSSSSSRKNNRSNDRGEDSGSGSSSSRREVEKGVGARGGVDGDGDNDKWLRPCLEQTIDNETQVEANPMSARSQVGGGIRREQEYTVIHVTQERGRP
ncbi:hypothetical protein F4778DRAFT_594839 [Xylariomycetidae sp. FL2044]|nr:hypothetical protein F4778DRAFT_594839 [Xylariomycetidae sp. FL2044]